MKYTFFWIFSFINNEDADRVIKWKIFQRHNDTFLRSLLDYNFSAIDSMKGSPKIGSTKYHSRLPRRRERGPYTFFSPLTFFCLSTSASWEKQDLQFCNVIHHIIICKIVKFVSRVRAKWSRVFLLSREMRPFFDPFRSYNSFHEGKQKSFFARSPEARYIDCIFGLLL